MPAMNEPELICQCMQLRIRAFVKKAVDPLCGKIGVPAVCLVPMKVEDA